MQYSVLCFVIWCFVKSSHRDESGGQPQSESLTKAQKEVPNSCRQIQRPGVMMGMEANSVH